MTDKRSITEYTKKELEEFLISLDEKPYRAAQIYEWLHVKGVNDTAEMTNIPKALRNKIGEMFPLRALSIENMQESGIDGTRKYLFRLGDDRLIESVYMRYRFGDSVCVSSQAGCRMGCRFCASTLGGLQRNLTASEMTAQVREIAADTGSRISRVVVMGSGEPFENTDNLFTFFRILTDPEGMAMSARNITVSTCGIVPGILGLAGSGYKVNLAISLHCAIPSKRKTLMPGAESAYPLDEVMNACRVYFARTGRQVTYEYAIIDGVNNTDEDITALTGLLKGLNCTLNLIPVNPVRERGYNAGSRRKTIAFKKKLEQSGINVTIRREMGRDIDGACGQLRMKYLDESGHV